jgi:hypothetical protein
MERTGARPLNERERGLLDAALAHDFVGVEALRAQTVGVQARPGCSCGCGTIELVPQDQEAPRSSAASPVPAEGRVRDGEGNEIGGLLVFVRDGLLDSLEVYSYDEPPLPLPDPGRVDWQVFPR